MKSTTQTSKELSGISNSAVSQITHFYAFQYIFIPIIIFVVAIVIKSNYKNTNKKFQINMLIVITIIMFIQELIQGPLTYTGISIAYDRAERAHIDTSNMEVMETFYARDYVNVY